MAIRKESGRRRRHRCKLGTGYYRCMAHLPFTFSSDPVKPTHTNTQIGGEQWKGQRTATWSGSRMSKCLYAFGLFAIINLISARLAHLDHLHGKYKQNKQNEIFCYATSTSLISFHWKEGGNVGREGGCSLDNQQRKQPGLRASGRDMTGKIWRNGLLRQIRRNLTF